MRMLSAALIAVALVVCGARANAAEWPARPIKIIAPSSPGGAADTFARLLAEFLPPLLHQPVIVDNRAGAGGLIGAAAAARAEPDGYTLVTSSIAYDAIAPALSPSPGFDPIRDFTRVAYLGGPPAVFIAHPGLAVHSLKDLIALGKNGRTLDYVSPGVGTLGHLLAERFGQETGISLQHIPHRGAAPAMLDLIAGSVKLGSMTWSSALAQIRAGTMIPLAVSADRRLAQSPTVPTFREEGFDDLTALAWYVLSGPAGLPDSIVVTLNRAVNQAWALPELQKRLADEAIEAVPMTPEEVTRFVTDEVRKWRPLARRIVHVP
jgi:tripartite-type tricarboxylate transporter receptor subunit TctC